MQVLNGAINANSSALKGINGDYFANKYILIIMINARLSAI